VIIDQEIRDRYSLYHADCMEVMPELPAKSIDLSVYSPPFPELYQYSNDPRDMTNCTSYDESIEQYGYVVRQIARLTKPGRLSCVHCTDLKRGQIYQRDFPGDVIRVHEDAGMHFFCRITVWKDPWHFARRTRMVTLMHKTLTEDSALSRVAPPDYLLVFKKAGVNAEPITHEKGLRRYAGATPIPPQLVRDFAEYRGDPRKNLMSHWIWRQYASPVWMDVRRKRLLPYADAKENPEEKHVCPLQLDVIDRCLTLWSNPGDVVLTPFMGVGSEVYCAVVHERRAIGVELKASYYRQAVQNVRVAVAGGYPAEQFSLDAEPGAGGDDEDDAAEDLPVTAEAATSKPAAAKRTRRSAKC
jgi:DNA modification methylase